MTPVRRFLRVVHLGRILTRMREVMIVTGCGGRMLKTKRLPFESPRERRNKQALNDDFARLVQKMWNRERIAWARAGYPGLVDRDISKLEPFFLGARFEHERPRVG